MIVRRMPVKALTPAQVEKLQSLTMGPNRGLMHGRLAWCVRNPEGCHVFVATHRRKIVGWALMYRTGPYRRNLYTFVHKEYRRKGVGTAIMNYVAAQKGRLRIRVFPWSKTSDAFYEKYRGVFEMGRA